jgi:hypothetical protein
MHETANSEPKKELLICMSIDRVSECWIGRHSPPRTGRAAIIGIWVKNIVGECGISMHSTLLISLYVIPIDQFLSTFRQWARFLSLFLQLSLFLHWSFGHILLITFLFHIMFHLTNMANMYRYCFHDLAQLAPWHLRGVSQLIDSMISYLNFKPVNVTDWFLSRNTPSFHAH